MMMTSFTKPNKPIQYLMEHLSEGIPGMYRLSLSGICANSSASTQRVHSSLHRFTSDVKLASDTARRAASPTMAIATRVT